MALSPSWCYCVDIWLLGMWMQRGTRLRSARTRRSDGGVRRRRYLLSALVVTTLLNIGLAGCTEASPQATSTPTTPSATSSSAHEKQAILSQYRKSYRVMKRAERVPPEQRRALLKQYLTDPQLSSVLNGIRKIREQGRLTYGLERVHPYNLKTHGDTATLHDCQDTRFVGQKDAETGEKLTKGIKYAHLIVNFVRGADGVWRVKRIRQVKQPCEAHI